MKNRTLVQFFTHDTPVAIVISLNAIVVFLLSFEKMENSLFLEVLDAIFLLYFVLEAQIKILQVGWQKYIRNGWNRFDFIIVLLSIPSLILLFKHNLSDFTFLFVFRIIRVIRFFKFIKFIPNIQELIAGVRRAFKASIFVLLTFFIFSFIISLISSRIFADRAPKMFGDPVISFYHTFRVFTIEGWYEVPEYIIAEGNMTPAGIFFTRFYFIVILISGGLIGLSIVNAIFVEEMVRDNNDDIILKMEAMEEKLNRLLEAQEVSARLLAENTQASSTELSEPKE